MASAGLSYQILDWLNVAGRVRIDNTHSEYEGKLYASSSNTLTDGSSQGHYTVNNGQYSQTYADVLVNINKRIQDFTIVANIGASYSGVTSKELGLRGLYEKLVFLICSMFTTLTTQKNVLRRWVGAKRPNLFLPVPK